MSNQINCHIKDCNSGVKMDVKSYTLNRDMQLIDINNDYTAFTTIYNVTCDNQDDEFEYAVVTQKQLNDNIFPFKKARGIYEDSISSQTVTNENWFLALKAPKETKCKVGLSITSLEPPPPPPPPPSSPVQSQPPPPVHHTPIPPPSRLRKQKHAKLIKQQQVYESDSEDEQQRFLQPRPTNPRKQYLLYAVVGIVLIGVILLGLWYLGYLTPVLNRFRGHSSSSTEIIPSSPPPIPSHPPVPVQSNYVPDMQFINEMRELKIDL